MPFCSDFSEKSSNISDFLFENNVEKLNNKIYYFLFLANLSPTASNWPPDISLSLTICSYFDNPAFLKALESGGTIILLVLFSVLFFITDLDFIVLFYFSTLSFLGSSGFNFSRDLFIF